MRWAIITLTLAISPSVTRAQVPTFGGCAQGSEMGYVRVRVATDLREWDTGTRVARAMPGDELRLCRFERDAAVVTIWARGYGYRIPQTAIDSVGLPTLRDLSERERDCVINAIDEIQNRYRSREQGIRLLELGRAWKISLFKIERLRLMNRAGRPADCTPPS